MSFIAKQLAKTFLSKKIGKDNLTVGKLDEDPYLESIPNEELHFWQRKGALRIRGIPKHIPEEKRKKLKRVQRMAYVMDAWFSRTGLKFGLGGVLTLVPVIGAYVVLVINVYILKKTLALEDFPAHIKSEMTFNLMLDFGIGLIPIVGDIFVIAYRADTRNFKIARDYMAKLYAGSEHVRMPTSGGAIAL